MAVAKSILSRLPSRARTPSAPRFHPPLSRSWFALSMLNSQRMFFDRKRSGLLSQLPVACPRRPRICSWMAVRSTRRARAPFTAGSVRKGCTVFTLDRSPSTSVHGSVWLSCTWVMRPPKPMATCPLPPCSSRWRTSSSAPHLRGVVVLAGLQHGARGGHRIPSAFDLDGVEEGAAGHMVVGIDLALEQIAGLELDEAIGPGAHGLEVVGRLP